MERLLFLFVLIVPFKSWSQERKTIIFVCEHGGARSTIASAYFNKLAKENNLPYQSVFRGLTPDSVISKATRKGLTSDGIETAGLSPVALSVKDVTSNAWLISLDCTAPPSYPTYQTWKGIPAISENYEGARNEILNRLNKLIMELKAKQTTQK
jgi:protein-tyrosine-phosphatase